MEMRRYEANCILGRWADGGSTYRHADDVLAAMDELGIARAQERHSLGAGYGPACADALLCQQFGGAERILLGNDVPWLEPRFLIGKVAYARLSAEEQRLILGENIARLMGWD